MSDVTPEEVEFLAYPFIPLRKLTLLEGDPGLGKTFLALFLTAIVSRGGSFAEVFGHQEGGESPVPAPVLYLTAEDGIGDTLLPRLSACGANLSYVHALTGWQARDEDGQVIEGVVTLGNPDVLDQAFDKVKPKLVVVDPLQAFLGGKVDMHRANEVRPLLTTLGRLAEKHNCAVVCIRHLAKASQGKAIYRGLGSIDFAAAARSILLVGEHPHNSGQRVLAHAKSSLAPTGQSMGFEIVDGALRWTGPCEVTADQLAGPSLSVENRSSLEDAVQFLNTTLAEGPMKSKDLMSEAQKAGISLRTLDRARSSLKVPSYPEIIDGKRVWFCRLRDNSLADLANKPESKAPTRKSKTAMNW